TDTRVVPGSSISAWVIVTSTATGEPIPNAPVDLSLVEGGVPRFEARLTTDPAGNAMARVPIPRNDEPAWSWQLVAPAFDDDRRARERRRARPRGASDGLGRRRQRVGGAFSRGEVDRAGR